MGGIPAGSERPNSLASGRRGRVLWTHLGKPTPTQRSTSSRRHQSSFHCRLTVLSAIQRTSPLRWLPITGKSLSNNCATLGKLVKPLRIIRRNSMGRRSLFALNRFAVFGTRPTGYDRPPNAAAPRPLMHRRSTGTTKGAGRWRQRLSQFPTRSSAWSRAGPRPTSSSACCPGPGKPSGPELI